MSKETNIHQLGSFSLLQSFSTCHVYLFILRHKAWNRRGAGREGERESQAYRTDVMRGSISQTLRS